MYLKKVEMQGFKSFAQKIELNFEQGVTGVVGPNGSGKSNISDAIRWVLGEQSIKTLRGSKAEDVIFSGTTTKKPLGMAEVSITLDNKLKILHTEYEEVTITRRVYRTGESEYYLNKTLCRLKDIRELLMDTGIGKDGYSIIGQGKIDEILSNKSEDRRLVFEEAAGIVKYKTRKMEAEKKLNSTQENLSRISDIMNELESQLGPLEKQSTKAKQYKEIKEKLLKFEVSLFIKEIDKLDHELQHIKDQLQVLEKSKKEQLTQKEIVADRLSIVEQNIIDGEEQFTSLKDKRHDLENKFHDLQGTIKLNNEKIHNNETNIKRLLKELKEIEYEEVNITNELKDKQICLDQIKKEIKQINLQLKEEENDYNNLVKIKTDKEYKVELSKTQIIEELNKISDLKAEAKSLITLTETMDDREKQLTDQIFNTENQEKVLKEDIKKCTAEIMTVKNDIDKSNTQTLELDKKLEDIRNLIINENKNLEKNKNDLSQNASRLNIIKDMERANEGFSKGTKNLLKACKNNKNLSKGVFGAVADLIKVPDGYEVAIETALGASIQNIVCDTDDTGKNLIQYLKKHKLGRVTILPLSTILKKSISIHEEKIINSYNDKACIAYEIVEFDQQYSRIVSSLLNRVIVTKNLDIGIELAKKLAYKFKIVTVDGDIINTGGSLTGGSNNRNVGSVFERKKEIEKLNEKVANLKNTLNIKERKIEELENDQRKLLTCKQEVRENVQGKKLILNSLNHKSEQLDKEFQQVKKIKQMNIQEKFKLTDVIKDSQIKLENINNKITNSENFTNKIRNDIAESKEVLTDETSNIQKLSDDMVDKKITISSKEEQKNSLLKDINALEQNLSSSKEKAIMKQKQKDEIISETKTITEELLKNKDQLITISLKSNGLKSDMERLSDSNRELAVVRETKKNENDQVDKLIADLQNSIYKLDIKRNRLEAQQQNFYNRLWDEYEMTYVDAQKVKIDIGDITSTSKKIKDYKHEIKSLGNINLEAIDMYEEVKKRYEFLNTQQEDLILAKKSLLKVIQELEVTIKNKFLEQFKIIKKNFNNVFTKLFGGGKADLILLDEENILDCGIDIVAQPPGKKLQNLTLLSGGERALTAISILFAILLVKPTPFCILDEIEAALDDANVFRFADFLKELSVRTQFIVVTHRKGTMEAADALYGVTMEQEGISKLVSVRLVDIENEIAAS
ncbi:chromosome segregation protein SMC [Serpentinicella sp. ANB-PHB4]|uniref:chromosome segregation protein SMC n=1 Tax=Serpentinicella sp. ANB-PHB4 TaxID=3074076 RepID=UPI0028587DB1|nr:chromosome segregation protein SMC [Serpentinicella sp. ANB-PHB4]MDR5658291.1 chromosome segregation protein SMC [Serpentinicella sp. ANB-PHB4]